jgi:hypothetical protein
VLVFSGMWVGFSFIVCLLRSLQITFWLWSDRILLLSDQALSSSSDSDVCATGNFDSGGFATGNFDSICSTLKINTSREAGWLPGMVQEQTRTV